MKMAYVRTSSVATTIWKVFVCKRDRSQDSISIENGESFHIAGNNSRKEERKCKSPRARVQVGTKILTDGCTGYKQLEKLGNIFWRFLCPSNDQNRRDGGAWIVANDRLDDQASSVLLRTLQRGWSSG